jgi:hypothetical protein
VIQGCFIYHVFKTGRPYWWAFVILSFPVLGCVVYYFVEIFPHSREHRAARRATRNIARSIAPDRELRRRAEELQICGSVDNKVALAEECVRSGMYADAVSLYESCLSGIHAGDPKILLRLGEAQLLDGQFEWAAASLRKLKSTHASYKPHEVRLLEARLTEAAGDDRAAMLQYELLAQEAVGVEAKVRYGLLLRKLGFLRQSEMILAEVLQHAKRFPDIPESEREWVELARASISAP